MKTEEIIKKFEKFIFFSFQCEKLHGYSEIWRHFYRVNDGKISVPIWTKFVQEIIAKSSENHFQADQLGVGGIGAE